MTTPLTLTTDRRDDGSVVLTASGEIDLSRIQRGIDVANLEHLDWSARNAKRVLGPGPAAKPASSRC